MLINLSKTKKLITKKICKKAYLLRNQELLAPGRDPQTILLELYEVINLIIIINKINIDVNVLNLKKYPSATFYFVFKLI